jgi:hypothetical protein
MKGFEGKFDGRRLPSGGWLGGGGGEGRSVYEGECVVEDLIYF